LLDALGDSLGSAKPDPDLTSRVEAIAGGVKNSHFLIATVPDPVHTHLSLLFDRQIVSIEEAVQQGGYLFSRAYLPWDNVQHPEDTDFRLRLKEEDYQDVREDFPGLLVFHYRENLGSTPLGPLFVFLVTETPTGGINRGQFTNAIAAINGICSKGCAQPLGKTGTLYVLGPTFSGSFYSLRDILREQQENQNLSSVVIHSGTASDSGTINWFTGLQQDSFPVSVIFRTFEEGNDYELSHLLSFVCREGFHADQMAVLSEDETAYGAGNTRDEGGKRDEGEKEKNRANAETCPDNGDRKVLHLFFPRDISALRNAYQQDSKVSGASGGSSAPRSTLSLNLEDHGNDDDSIAVFSQDQTPLSEEAVMMGIVSDLRDHRTNLVVIEATNPVDIVFLVRYFRAAYSDARIITLGSDLLLPRQVDDPRLRGVMQVSSYSLIPEIDHYTTVTNDGCAQPSFLNRIFPSDYSVGTFNALLSLMEFQGSAYRSCSPDKPSGAPNDLISSAYVQYGWPALARPLQNREVLVPPLWLTVQGRDQFWPVELLDGVGTSEPASLLHAISSKTRSDPAHPRLPISWSLVFALGLAFGVTHLLLAWNGNIISPSVFSANFAPVEDPWRNLTVLCCGVVIFDILACLLLPEFWFVGQARWAFFTLVSLVCLAICGDLQKRGGWRFVTWSLLIGAASFVVLEVAFRADGRPLSELMKYRYSHIASGVSPFVPFLLLFAGCLWVLWHTLSGRPPWDRFGRGPQLPSYASVISKRKFGADSPADRQRLSALTREGNARLLDAMRPGKPMLQIFVPAFLAWALFGLSGVVPGSPHRIQSFEGQGYDLVYSGFVLLLILVLLASAFRLASIWLELRRLLMVLDRVPLRRGFARMTGINSKRLWQLGGSTFEDYFSILSKEIHTVTALANSVPRGAVVPYRLLLTSANVAQFASWIQRTPGAEKRRTSFNEPLSNALRRMQVVLAGTCGAILRELNQTWNDEIRTAWDAECIERERKLGEQGQCKEPELPLTVRLCEDFVCLFYLNFITSVFTRMRSLVLTIVGLYVFVLLSFSSYPFEPSSTFHTAMIFLFVFIAVVIGIVYGQAEKNATLSRITQTNVGELGVEFWFRLAAVISVPLLSLLAAKFPEIGGFLFSWLEPASQAFR
jgi:hypothetical protein